MPKVSIVIPTYNRSRFVCEAIESVLNQSFKDFEIIVVDDGSTDNTKEALKKYSNHISYIYQDNRGRSLARSAGIKAAKGDYIAFLDDDDIWLPGKLEKQVDFFNTFADIGLVHTFTEVINEQGLLLEKETRKRLGSYSKAIKIGYTYEGMSQFCVMFISSVMLRSCCLSGLGLFDPIVEALEDWDFYLRFSLKFRIGTITEPLVRYRLHKLQSTQDDFTNGCIMVSMKHLAMISSFGTPSFCKRARRNFYLQLANAYYISRQLTMFRSFALKAVRSNPWMLFKSRLALHFLISLMPFRAIQAIRQLKGPQLRKINHYPERIIPGETLGGPLASHLKRYDFARQFCNGKVVLDAACGVGYGSSYLAEVAREVIGIDISQEAITYALQHYQKENARFKKGDIHNLEFSDDHFDIICSFETLEHLDRPEKFINEISRVLRKEGKFIFSVPHVRKTKYNPENPYHRIEFSQKDLESILKKYFREVEIFGERRLQSVFHYYLQRIDIFHLRALLSNSARSRVCHALATRCWDEVSLKDIVISKEGISRSTELIGVCRFPIRRSL